MKTILYTDLNLDEKRQRDDFDGIQDKHLQDLASSIRYIGLIHPIVLDPNTQTIRAGECRYRACCLLFAEFGEDFTIQFEGELLEPGHMPYIYHSHEDAERTQAVEFHENVCRLDFNWKMTLGKEAALVGYLERQTGSTNIEVLHNQALAEGLFSINPDLPPSQDPDRKKLIRGKQYIQYGADEEVQNAKTSMEAERILQRKVKEGLQALLVSHPDNTALKDTEHQFHNTTVEILLPTLPDNTITTIILDPPYGIGADNFSQQQSGNTHDYTDSLENLDSILNTLFNNLDRITADTAHLFLFFDFRNYDRLISLWRQHHLSKAGWQLYHKPLIWTKTRGNIGDEKYFPIPRYEPLLYMRRGEDPLILSFKDHFSFALKDDEVRTHGAQKPVALYEYLLTATARTGSIVADFCAGSGPIITAAENLGLSAVIAEPNTKYFTACQSRAL